MPNKDLCFRILPAQMIVKNFVDGCGYCNYELYLRDFINVSAFFIAKSHNAPYTPPTSEENGQCDCESDNTDRATDLNMNFIDIAIKDRLVQQKLKYYRQYAAPILPNNQQYNAG